MELEYLILKFMLWNGFRLFVFLFPIVKGAAAIYNAKGYNVCPNIHLIVPLRSNLSLIQQISAF